MVGTACDGGGCRSVRRRQERLAHWRACNAYGIRAKKELCNNLERGCVVVGRPPDDLAAAGALGELCGLRVDSHDDECGPLVFLSRCLLWSSCILLRVADWLKRGLTLFFVRLNSSVPSWVL